MEDHNFDEIERNIQATSQKSNDDMNMDNEPEVNIIYEGDEGYKEAKDENIEVANHEPEETIETEEYVEEVQQRPKSKKPKTEASTRINQVTRKYYEELRRAEKAEQMLDEMKHEHEKLRKQYDSNNKAVLSSQEAMIDAQIRNAKYLKGKALEEGDIHSQVEADEALAAAVTDKRNLDAWKMQQKMYEEEMSKQSANPPQNVPRGSYSEPQQSHISPETFEWVEENPWFDQKSDEFDPDLYQKAMSYAAYLDNKYVGSGKQDRILSHEYFDDINRYMQKHLNPVKSKSNNIKGELVMNRPRSNVAGVSGSNYQGQNRETFRMSQAEQDMARAHGWSDQQWFKNKKLAQRMIQNNRLTQGFGNKR